jgi:hypothetical protein
MFTGFNTQIKGGRSDAEGDEAGQARVRHQVMSPLPSTPHTLGHIGLCEQEQGVMECLLESRGARPIRRAS